MIDYLGKLNQIQMTSDSLNPIRPFAVAWQHRRLIWRLAKRDVLAQYRGSLMGPLWGVIVPLATLAVYTFVFTNIFRVRWVTSTEGGTAEFALLMFSGLLVFGVFAETINRSPTLISGNVSYVKKVVFPLEILPWVSATTALCTSAMGFAALLITSFFVRGLPPVQLPLFLLALVPVVLLGLGFAWFLASLGVFIRDIKHVVGVSLTLLMFLTPILYPLSAVPSDVQWVLKLNPLTPIMEFSKVTLFFGGDIQWRALFVLVMLAWLIAWLGFVWFMKTKKAFADVI